MPSATWAPPSPASRRRSTWGRPPPRAPTRLPPVRRRCKRMVGESGMTLAELLVVLSLLGVVLPMLALFLISIQRTVVRESDRTQSNDQARLAVQELDREIRSGNVL